MRETRRVTRNSESEEVGDEAQRYSLEKHRPNHETHIQDSIKVKRQKERSRLKLWQLFIHLPYTVHNNTEVNLNYVAIE